MDVLQHMLEKIKQQTTLMSDGNAFTDSVLEWTHKNHSLINILQKEQCYQIQALNAQMHRSHFMLTYGGREDMK